MIRLQGRPLTCWVVAAVSFAAVFGCRGASDESGVTPTESSAALSGKVTLDGSITVYPIMEAVAVYEQYRILC